MVVAILLVGSVAGATETVSTDGVWWNGLDDHEKAVAMFAATSAYQAGYFQGQMQMANREYIVDLELWDHFKVPFQQAVAFTSKDENIHRSAVQTPDFSGRPVGSYIEGVNAFYDSHPDKTTIDFAYVLQCVQNNPTKTCDKVAMDGR
jgi:hypothetical protein